MPTQFCPDCGTQKTDVARFCQQCGAQLAPRAQPALPATPFKTVALQHLLHEHYVIVEQLAQGGMGALYRCRVRNSSIAGDLVAPATQACKQQEQDLGLEMFTRVTSTANCWSGICIGGSVVVVGTRDARLRVRAVPGLSGQVLVSVDDGDVLDIIDGPREADGYTWWQVRTPDGTHGWVAANWLEPVD